MAVNKIKIYDPHGNLLYQGSFSGVDTVQTSVVDDGGEQSVVASYDEGVLTLTFKNIEGQVTDVQVNGVSVTVDKIASVVVPTKVSELENDSNFATQDAVDEVAEDVSELQALYQGLTQTGIVIVAAGDWPLAELEERTVYRVAGDVSYTDYMWNGSEIIPMAIYSGQLLYNTTGGNIDGAMTQAATTSLVNDRTFIVDSEVEDTTSGTIRQNIYNDVWYSPNASSGDVTYGRGIDIDVQSLRGKTMLMAPQSGGTIYYAFTVEHGTTGQTVDYATGSGFTSSTTPVAVSVPNDAIYLWYNIVRNGVDVAPSSIQFGHYIKEDVEANAVNLETLQETVEDNAIYEKVLTTCSQERMGEWTSYWYIENGVWKSTTGNNKSKLTNISAYKGYKMAFVRGNGTMQYAFLTARGSSSGDSVDYCEDTSLVSSAVDCEADIPEDAVYFYIRWMSGGTNVLPTSITIKDVSTVKAKIAELDNDKRTLVYVNANSGNDSNTGSSSSPLATMAAALDAGAKDMTVILQSDTTETINLASWNEKKNHVTIRGSKDARSRIIAGKKLEGLTAYSGYNDVYTYTPSESETLPSGTRQWLWQHGLPDSATEILSNERHPLQRGRQYRRLSTCLVPETSLSNLLASNSPCWVVDSDILYLRVATGSDIDTYPVYIAEPSAVALNGALFDVTLCNIETWYGNITAYSGSYKFEATDCASRYCVGSGAWQIDDAMCVKLTRCEADSTTMESSSTGDGFNLHPTSGSDIYAKGGTHTLIDCWAHDCRDDAYSDHGRSEGTIIGGLFEYCGKGGILPSYGSHDTIYNATARQCYYGIYCAGDASDSGKGTQVDCHGCVCSDNDYNYRCSGDNTSGAEVRMILSHCISKNATVSAYTASAYGSILARECTDLGSATVKTASSNGVITIENGTIVTE